MRTSKAASKDKLSLLWLETRLIKSSGDRLYVGFSSAVIFDSITCHLFLVRLTSFAPDTSMALL